MASVFFLVFKNSVHHWNSDKCPAVKYVDAVVAGMLFLSMVFKNSVFFWDSASAVKYMLMLLKALPP